MSNTPDPEIGPASSLGHGFTLPGGIGGNLYHDSRQGFQAEYNTGGLAGVEGGLGATIGNLWRDSLSISRMSSAAVDEAELVEYCQQEAEAVKEAKRTGQRFKPPRLPKVPTRAQLESLNEEVLALQEKTKATGKVMDFKTQVAALVEQYKPSMPTVTVKYENLSVETDALVGSAGIPTVGNTFIHMLQSFVCIKPPTVTHRILHSAKGVLLPGRLTLLLGPPSSGKSTFLKVLAGRYQDSAKLRVKGSVTYNAHSFDEFMVNRTSGFVSQHDNHIALLTVFETLMFAHVCQQGFNTEQYNLMGELRQAMQRHKSFRDLQEAKQAHGSRFANQDTEAGLGASNTVEELKEEIISLGERIYQTPVKILSLMRAFGIAHTRDTPIGDAMLRGVSGGERKRVTVTEMLVGPRRIMFLDEISTGLDSATLYSIISQMAEYTHAFQTTMLVSLLQPPPEVYNLFDDLCLLSDGHVVYHGPVGGAMDFFTSLGFICPIRKDVPSFLQEVTTPSGQLEFASPALLKQKGIDRDAVEPGALRGFLIPIDDVVNAFWQTDAGRRMQELIDTPYDKSTMHPQALTKTRFALTPLQMLVVVTAFQVKLVLKDPVLIKGRLIQIVVIGLLVGGLFFRLEPSFSTSRTAFGALFLSVMFVAMGSMPQLAITMAYKPVWYKWRDNQFYPGWVHAFASAFAQIPVSIIDAAAWSLVTYFMWGLYQNAGYFFIYYLILLCMNISCGCLFRMIAHIAPDGVAANSFGGLTLLVLIVMSGFSIVRGSIPDWWIWAYYISPFAWCMRAVVINEFTSPRWQELPAENASGTLGDQALLSFDFFLSRSWIWAGIGFMLGSAILFTMGSGLALQYLTPSTAARVADEEAVEAARQEAAARKKAAAAAKQGANQAQAKQAGQGAEHQQELISSSVCLDVDIERVGTINATPCQLLGPCPGAIATNTSAIPFTPITVVWQDLKYFVPNPSWKKGLGPDGPPERLELLKGITGFAEPGSLTALMGGSGAGKTTLMDCIAGRKTVGEITGEITVNGHPKDQSTWARVVGYCEQMDIHTPAQTVIEALMFSARLRLPRSISNHDVRAYVEEVMDIVELMPIQFDLVGLPGSGLSVEQRKRLTIGVELVANPSVVFMDEPTSGLDARAAAIVMRAVRNVARNNRAVLVTIHQPSIEIFEAFDRLLLLQRGGRTTYFGPLGQESKHLVAYLQAVPGCPEIVPGYNPATWMLEVTGGALSVMAQAVDADWPELFKESALAKENVAKAAELVERDRTTLPVLTVEGGEFASSMGTQLRELLKKYMLAYWRTPSYNFTRYMVTVLVAILYGSIYYKAGDISAPATVASVQNVMGVIYSSTSFMGMTNMMAAMPIIGLERVVLYRERAASTYNPWSFGATMALVEIPYVIAQVILFVCIMYPMVGYASDAGRFFYYMLMTFLSLIFYTSFGMAMVNITPSQQLAQVASAGLNFLFNIFNGFVITYPAMGKGWQWINRIVPPTWILYGLASDQLGNDTTPMSYPGNPNIKTVADFLRVVFGYDYSIHYWTLLMILAYILFLRVAGVLALRYMSFLKR